MSDTAAGKLEVRNTASDKVHITLDGDSANIRAGGQGADGGLVLCDSAERERISIGRIRELSEPNKKHPSDPPLLVADYWGLAVHNPPGNDLVKIGWMPNPASAMELPSTTTNPQQNEVSIVLGNELLAGRLTLKGENGALVVTLDRTGAEVIGDLQVRGNVIVRDHHGAFGEPLSVKWFGAKGDGVTDDTKAIQDAVDHANGTVFIPAGTYMIDAVTSPAGEPGRCGIRLPSNFLLQLSPRATLRAIPNSAQKYSILQIYDVHDVTVVGGTLQGDRAQHIGTLGEWGMGLDIRSSTNVMISGVLSRDLWGDGFYVGKWSTNNCQNVRLYNCIGENNRRQGCSIVSLIGGVLDGCLLVNSNGPSLGAGLDLEPSDGSYIVQDVRIVNSYFRDNQGPGIQLDGNNGPVSVCLISGNICRNNHNGIVLLSATDICLSHNLCTDANIGVDAADCSKWTV